MTRCQGSDKRIWVPNSGQMSKGSKGGPGLTKRNKLTKRQPKSSKDTKDTKDSKDSKDSKDGSEDGSKIVGGPPKGESPSKGSKGSDPARNNRGYCLDAPTTKIACEEVENGYFWDTIGTPACVFKTQCEPKLNNGKERDWIAAENLIDGKCVNAPSGRKACRAAENYDWYKASGSNKKKCHYKQRCKLEPKVSI
jgi:hypothetical protein